MWLQKIPLRQVEPEDVVTTGGGRMPVWRFCSISWCRRKRSPSLLGICLIQGFAIYRNWGTQIFMPIKLIPMAPVWRISKKWYVNMVSTFFWHRPRSIVQQPNLRQSSAERSWFASHLKWCGNFRRWLFWISSIFRRKLSRALSRKWMVCCVLF